MFSNALKKQAIKRINLPESIINSSIHYKIPKFVFQSKNEVNNQCEFHHPSDSLFKLQIKTHPDYFNHSSLKPTGNISRYQENNFIYSNPNHDYYKIPSKNKQLKKNEKYQFKFNNIINIEKNKIMTYFLCNNFEELFSLFELYIASLFNGINMELIPGLFKRELITDSVYINVMKCIEIINENKQLYKRIFLRNTSNRLDTTEIICKVEEVEHINVKDDALLLLLKFIDLLKGIDEKIFIKEISKLNEIFQKNNF
jgi:hypothetical protein